MNAITEQQWAHHRDFIIKFPQNKFEPEQRAGFRVEQAGSAEFLKIMNEYLYFCASREALIQVKVEVSDSESKQPCLMLIEIEGARYMVGHELQRIGNSLIKHSTQIV